MKAIIPKASLTDVEKSISFLMIFIFCACNWLEAPRFTLVESVAPSPGPTFAVSCNVWAEAAKHPARTSSTRIFFIVSLVSLTQAGLFLSDCLCLLSASSPHRQKNPLFLFLRPYIGPLQQGFFPEFPGPPSQGCLYRKSV